MNIMRFCLHRGWWWWWWWGSWQCECHAGSYTGIQLQHSIKTILADQTVASAGKKLSQNRWRAETRSTGGRCILMLNHSHAIIHALLTLSSHAWFRNATGFSGLSNHSCSVKNFVHHLMINSIFVLLLLFLHLACTRIPLVESKPYILHTDL